MKFFFFTIKVNFDILKGYKILKEIKAWVFF